MSVNHNTLLKVGELEKTKFEGFLINLLKGDFKIQRRGSGYTLIEDNLKDYQTMEDSILDALSMAKNDGNYKALNNLRRLGHHIAIMSSSKKRLPNVISKYDRGDIPRYLSGWAKDNSLDLKVTYINEDVISFAVIPLI